MIVDSNYPYLKELRIEKVHHRKLCQEGNAVLALDINKMEGKYITAHLCKQVLGLHVKYPYGIIAMAKKGLKAGP